MGIEDLIDGALEQPIPDALPAPIIEEVVEAQPTPEAVPEVVPEPVVQPEAKEADKSVPLPTFLDMRDKLKAAERRLAEVEAAKSQAPQNVPDPYDDPDGFARHTEQRVEQALVGQRFQMSDMLAKKEYGAETVEAAAAWAMEKAQADPTFAASYMREPHPIDWIVRQHKRDGIVSQLPDDISSLDELIQRKIAEMGLTAPTMTPVVVEQQQAPVTPPRSLASSSSRGGGVKDIPTGPMAALEAVFK